VPQGSREKIELERLLADLALQFGDALRRRDIVSRAVRSLGLA
jgi:hypothetical protein